MTIRFWAATLLALAVLSSACGGDDAELEGESGGEGPQPHEAQSLTCFGAIVPGPSGDGDDDVRCDEGTINIGGVRGNFDAALPPLPSGLVAVSDYIEFEIDEDRPAIAGIALPINQPVSDLSALGFYTYQGGEWRLVQNVAAIQDGKAEGEFTSFPANLAVLKRVR